MKERYAIITIALVLGFAAFAISNTVINHGVNEDVKQKCHEESLDFELSCLKHPGTKFSRECGIKAEMLEIVCIKADGN